MKKIILLLLVSFGLSAQQKIKLSQIEPFQTNYNRDYLKDWDAQISKIQQATASSTASVIWIGDSWISGTYFTPNIASYLRLKFGDAGCGYFGAGTGNQGISYGSNNQAVSRTKVGSWANKVGTTYVKAVAISADSSSTVNDSIYYVGVATDFVVHYMKKASGGDFVIRVDGTNPTTVTTAGTSTLAFSSKTGLTEGTHTLSIKVSTAGQGVLICGTEINRNQNGVRLHNLGCSGTTSTNWKNQDSSSWAYGIQQLNPNLAIITLGVNDCVQGITASTYIGNITRIVNRIKAAMPYCSILLFSQGDISTATTYPMSQYITAFKNYALINNYAFIDNYSLLGAYASANARGMYSDAVHLSASGGRLLTNNFLDYVMDGMPMYYDWNTNTNYGKNSMLSVVSSGAYNTALGVNTMSSTTTGSNNVAIGYNTLLLNTTGHNNLGVGGNSLTYNTAGSHNIAMGANSLYTTSTGSFNVALGSSSMLSNTTGESNTAIGYWTLKAATNGAYNVAIGSNALQANTGARYNNTAIGTGALVINSSGSNNTAIGYQTGGAANASGSGNNFIGCYAGYRETGSNILRIDNQARASLAVERTNAIINGTMAATPAAQTLQINAHTQVLHLIGNTSTPTATVGGGAGVSATYTITSGSTDVAGSVQVTTGTLPNTADNVITFTFANAYSVAPTIILTPANAATAALNGTNQVYATTTTKGFSIISGSVALGTPVVYKWNWIIVQ